jgi:hypothetical protein
VGAALRIAYVLDYGVPGNYAEIAAGQDGTDYDNNGFLWTGLTSSPPTSPPTGATSSASPTGRPSDREQPHASMVRSLYFSAPPRI